MKNDYSYIDFLSAKFNIIKELYYDQIKKREFLSSKFEFLLIATTSYIGILAYTVAKLFEARDTRNDIFDLMIGIILIVSIIYTIDLLYDIKHTFFEYKSEDILSQNVSKIFDDYYDYYESLGEIEYDKIIEFSLQNLISEYERISVNNFKKLNTQSETIADQFIQLFFLVITVLPMALLVTIL